MPFYEKIKVAILHTKIPLFISIGIFFLGFIAGVFLFYYFDPNAPDTKIFEIFPGVQKNDPIAFVINNGIVILKLISGSLFLGLTTFFFLSLNGLVFGAAMAISMQNASLTTVLLLTMPHAIFELPSIWFAGAAGFKIPYELICYFTNKKDYILNKEEVIDFLIMIGIAIVLIFIAAFVEAYITARIGETVNHL